MDAMIFLTSGKRYVKQLPQTKDPLVLRTDFSSQAVWQEIISAIQRPVGILRFRANMEYLDDIEYAGLTKDKLSELVPKNYNHSFIAVVDQAAIAHPEHPLLIVDLLEGSGNEFRAIPSQIQGIENNLSIANMDFEEFAEAVDEDGIFRGFAIK